ncbi:hypothetical protein AXF42_Ash019289 [Apostasia shenzhenica]|uniref:Late embryogenesis abundant protein LEA-2 subgroup domain-containing protein n=1 Tax=Apostasia shenzhenica TaxID=1088818 RepID=A0A2I0AR82_9ASPA|nr:hypothetical protein AXF42_Ash019289 [Apostasia shenzhenica]
MEEGGPPSRVPPLPRPPTVAAGDTETYSSTVVPVSPSPLTYVVQVPKEQIYRVPPPENARLAEQYRDQVTAQRRRRSPCVKFLFCFLAIAAIFAVLLLLAALIFYVAVRPAAPSIKVEHLVLEDANARLQYEVGLEVRNPSLGLSYEVENGGAATLTDRRTRVADGTPPGLYLKAKETKDMKLSMNGAKKRPPEAAEEKKAATMRLSMAMTVRPVLGSLRLWGMKMTVGCDVTAKSLGKKTRLLSQECETSVDL